MKLGGAEMNNNLNIDKISLVSDNDNLIIEEKYLIYDIFI